MFLTKFFKKLGKGLSNLWKNAFNSIEKVWNKIEPEVQEGIKFGSGLTAIINDNLDKAPGLLIGLVRSKFPEATEEDIRAGLLAVNKKLNLASDLLNTPLETLVGNVLKYLSDKEGTDWADASNTIAKIISISKAPKGTKVATIIMTLEHVYQTYFNKSNK